MTFKRLFISFFGAIALLASAICVVFLGTPKTTANAGGGYEEATDPNYIPTADKLENTDLYQFTLIPCQTVRYEIIPNVWYKLISGRLHSFFNYYQKDGSQAGEWDNTHNRFANCMALSNFDELFVYVEGSTIDSDNGKNIFIKFKQEGSLTIVDQGSASGNEKAPYNDYIYIDNDYVEQSNALNVGAEDLKKLNYTLIPCQAEAYVVVPNVWYKFLSGKISSFSNLTGFNVSGTWEEEKYGYYDGYKLVGGKYIQGDNIDGYREVFVKFERKYRIDIRDMSSAGEKYKDYLYIETDAVEKSNEYNYKGSPSGNPDTPSDLPEVPVIEDIKTSSGRIYTLVPCQSETYTVLTGVWYLILAGKTDSFFTMTCDGQSYEWSATENTFKPLNGGTGPDNGFKQENGSAIEIPDDFIYADSFTIDEGNNIKALPIMFNRSATMSVGDHSNVDSKYKNYLFIDKNYATKAADLNSTKEQLAGLKYTLVECRNEPYKVVSGVWYKFLSGKIDYFSTLNSDSLSEPMKWTIDKVSRYQGSTGFSHPGKYVQGNVYGDYKEVFVKFDGDYTLSIPDKGINNRDYIYIVNEAVEESDKLNAVPNNDTEQNSSERIVDKVSKWLNENLAVNVSAGIVGSVIVIGVLVLIFKRK